MIWVISSDSFVVVRGREYITIPNAVSIVQQRYPGYRAENLYNAAKRINRKGKPALETIVYQNILSGPRLLIPRPAFETWLTRLEKRRGG